MSSALVQGHGSNWSVGINPIDFDADYHAAIDWYGVPEELRADIFDCTHDAVLNGAAASDLAPFRARTSDLDTFKGWIGLPDAYIRSGKAIAPPYDPARVYDHRFADPAAVLNDDESRDLLLAAGSYLFGDSAAVANYRCAIELRMAPFEIAVYAVRRLILRPSSSLTIVGPPAVVIANRIELHSGATITTQTVSRILSDHLVKIEV
ncbi:MAG TPA: hypothetical protein VHS58_23745 [Acetobacteraceae bacterium]|jgi:hypothetical protein|nr:hypothetical protein [Acetobacteraceae bacterium]